MGVALVAAAAVMLFLDLVFLGILARGLYDSLLGPLRRPEVHWPAAAAFYALYLSMTVVHAVTARSRAAALGRGAQIGLLAYGTYELTNWAVLRDWPALLVPLDLGWGIALTAAVAFVAKWAHDAVMGSTAAVGPPGFEPGTNRL